MLASERHISYPDMAYKYRGHALKGWRWEDQGVVKQPPSAPDIAVDPLWDAFVDPPDDARPRAW
jgi:hypothetical protein